MRSSTLFIIYSFIAIIGIRLCMASVITIHQDQFDNLLKQNKLDHKNSVKLDGISSKLPKQKKVGLDSILEQGKIVTRNRMQSHQKQQIKQKIFYLDLQNYHQHEKISQSSYNPINPFIKTYLGNTNLNNVGVNLQNDKDRQTKIRNLINLPRFLGTPENDKVNKAKFLANTENETQNGYQTQIAQNPENSGKVSNNQPPIEKVQKKRYIINREFDDIGLYHVLPSTFVDGQVFRFSGIVLNPSLITGVGQMKFNYINVILSQSRGSNQLRFSQELTSSLQFDLSCKLVGPGRYFISIFAGRYGRSSIKLRNIVNSFNIGSLIYLPQTDNKPINARLQVIDNNLVALWDSDPSITNLTIYQQKGSQIIKKEYILSNYHQKFALPFSEFNQFQNTTTFIEISHAESKDGSLYTINSQFSKQISLLKFIATQHAFDEVIDQLMEIKPSIPWQFSVSSKMSFQATFKQDIRNQYYIVEPDLKIRQLYFIDPKNKLPKNTIKAGTPVSFELSFVKTGTHIFQINAVSGMALVNRPIYVGDSLPLIPDYRDLQPNSYGPSSKDSFSKVFLNYYERTTQKLNIQQPPLNSSLEEKRNFSLALLNGLRKKYGVNAVSLDEDLNKIAQGHSDDMAQNNYFSHTSPNGDGPGQRARKLNFTSSIGQNIAQSNYLTQAHLGLQRSAGHLQNSINNLWQRVGVGISITPTKQYIVVFQFSTRNLKKFPLTKQEQQKLQQDLIKLIRQKNPNIIAQNKRLSQTIQSWLQSERDTQFFQYIVSKGGMRGPMVASSFTISYSGDMIDRLKDANFLGGFANYKEVGVALAVDKQQAGMLQSYLVFK